MNRYLPLAERDAAASMLLTRLAARHPAYPVEAALAEIAADTLEFPVVRGLAEEGLAIARRRILNGATP